MGAPIRTILIVGGGLEGWFSALAIVRRLPGVRVSVFEDAHAELQPGDVYAGTRPGFRRVLRKLRVSEGPLLAAAGGVVRLGQEYVGWARSGASVLHAFGTIGTRIGPVAFHQAWLRAARMGAVAPFASHSAAVALARAGRVCEPVDDDSSPLATFDFGFNLDSVLLQAHLRTLAIGDGVEPIGGRLNHVEAAHGRIDALRLQGGRDLRADLFIDCSGPAAHILSAIAGDEREDWSHWLRANSVSMRDAAPVRRPALVDRAQRRANGWSLTAELASRTLEIAVTETQSGSSSAEREEGAGGAPIRLAALPQGRRRRFWVRNCLALGHAAITLEPLGAPMLHLLARGLDRMLTLLPDTDFDPVETSEYDRQVALEADRARDFVVLHHLLAGDFDGSDVEPPPMLASTLALFRARGKIPQREGESAELDDWLAVILGHGERVHELDPFLDAVQPEEFAMTSAGVRALIVDAIRRVPSHADFLAQLIRRG